MAGSSTYARKSGLTFHDPQKAWPGYVFFTPMSNNDALLVDTEGRIVHHWELKYPPGQHGKLLPNGNILMIGKGLERHLPIGGFGSHLLEVDWEGNVVWEYLDNTVNHDFQMMENGNILYNSYVEVPGKLAKNLKGGIPGSEAEGRVYTSCIREVNRDKKIVWEWNMAEHLDPDSYRHCPLCPRSVLGYINSLYEKKDGNILCTFRFQNQIAVIDKTTGGIEWQWGDGDDLGHPHAVSELENGNYLVFDNGLHRVSLNHGAHELSYSRIVEVDPAAGKIVWQYLDPNVYSFYSSICGGTLRLPNGNTFICESTKGRLFEVTPDNEIAWEYLNPFVLPRSDYYNWTKTTCVFQAHKYGADFEGFKDKKLDPSIHTDTMQKIEDKIRGIDEKQRTASRLERLGY